MSVADTQLQNLVRSPRFAKRAITNLSDVLRRRLCLQQPPPHMVWLTVASQCFQIARVANFPASFSFYSCVTMDGNPAFAVHATAHAFRAAINLNSMLLRQQIWCLGNYLIFDGLTNFMLKWNWCGSEGNYDDFYLWDLNNSWLLLQTSNCKWATASRVLVIIVYFSVTPRDAWERGHYGGNFFPCSLKSEATGVS